MGMIRKVVAVELFVRDLETCAAFYRDALGLDVQMSDAESFVFKIGDVYFFVMTTAGAADLISEGKVEVTLAGGPRGLLAVEVEDVDAAYETLKAKGVTFLRPPTDQPWGLRTAHFVDPEGNPWEIHHDVEAKPAQPQA
jgi:catechol 2,3-dioxygenase-like lactoylglutathione lyase family enzyme